MCLPSTSPEVGGIYMNDTSDSQDPAPHCDCRKPYVTPELTCFGSLDEVTQASGGSGADGGVFTT